jgi:hypothetical protein
VTKESFWKTVFKTPSAARTATVVMLVAWFIAAVWGWFFVEPTVLRDSQAARDYVEWASKAFSWLDNIRRLVPQAEKGLYLHSVYTVALAPFSVITAIVIMQRPEGRELEAAASLRDLLIVSGFCFALVSGGIAVMYNGILQPSFGKLHRTGYSFVLSPFTVPVVASFFIMGFWHVFAGGTYSAYLSVRKLMSKESRHG